MQAKSSFIEVRVATGESERTLVSRVGEEISIGTSSECALIIDDPSGPACHARLLWLSNDELIVKPFGPAHSTRDLQLDGEPLAATMPMRPGQRLTIRKTTVTWRWLRQEELPTMPGGAPSFVESPTAAAELAAELNNGRYQRGVEVGRGGMGKVLEAVENPLHRSVALKVLLDRGGHEDQHRFIQEARITGRLEHPSIVPVHELNVDQAGHVFYTMKLVKGVTLLQVLQDLAAGKGDALRRYTLPSLLTVFQKVCDAVAFAHAQQEPIIHRDLKP